MSTDPKFWQYAGKRDREIGNVVPALTEEDFYREIDDPAVAQKCYEAYLNGFSLRN